MLCLPALPVYLYAWYTLAGRTVEIAVAGIQGTVDLRAAGIPPFTLFNLDIHDKSHAKADQTTFSWARMPRQHSSPDLHTNSAGPPFPRFTNPLRRYVTAAPAQKFRPQL